MKIGEVARQIGVQASAIRFYEKRGLLPKAARTGGQRVYGPDVLRRLRLIEICQSAGFSLAEVEVLLRSLDLEEPESARELLQRKVEELDEIAKRATAMKEVLLTSFACGCTKTGQCAAVDSALGQIRLPARTSAAQGDRDGEPPARHPVGGVGTRERRARSGRNHHARDAEQSGHGRETLERH